MDRAPSLHCPARRQAAPLCYVSAEEIAEHMSLGCLGQCRCELGKCDCIPLAQHPPATENLIFSYGKHSCMHDIRVCMHMMHVAEFLRAASFLGSMSRMHVDLLAPNAATWCWKWVWGIRIRAYMWQLFSHTVHACRLRKHWEVSIPPTLARKSSP